MTQFPLPVQRTEIDGVPTYWSDVPGPVRGCLMFRVGSADEQLAHRGLTHLTEHLAMPPHRRHHFECNAVVEEARTTFWAHGSEDEVSSFLSETCARLSSLPLERLEAERGILRTEEEASGPSAFWVLVVEYFGARGYGLGAYPQYGIPNARPEDVTAWATRYFTSGNAALWLTGPPPPGLRLDLPDGERIAAPRPEVVPDLPAVRQWGSGGGLTAGGLVPRSVAANTAGRILSDRIGHRLRYELGVSYSMSTDYDRWTADDAFVLFWPDVQEEREQEALDAMLADVASLASDGPTEDELAHARAGVRRTAADSSQLGAYLDSMAHDELVGSEVLTREDILAFNEALTAAEVAEAAGALQDALLWVVPESVEVPGDRAHPVHDVSPHRVEGRLFRRRRGKLLRRPDSDVFVVGDEGASFLFADEDAITVLFRECEALLRWESGQRGLVGRDGFRIWLDDPDEWSRGDELVALLDAAVPEDRHVPMTD